ncbi:MAG: pseudouridine synthase [Candidatus Dormibacteria bacterium]
MSPPAERLNRHLARRTGVSRRAADELIAAGRVRVAGRTAVLGTQVEDGQDVRLDQRPLPPPAAPRTLLLNKPVGVISTRFDPHGRPTVVDLVGDRTLVPVGRLDADSRGLLLLSSDGALTERLTHPRHGVEKVYRISFSRPPPPAALERLRAGALLEDGPARPLAVRPARGGRVEIVMGEGRRREVRRLCAAFDLDVVDLERVGFGPLRLGSLPSARFRDLEGGERAALYAAAGLPIDVRRARR